MEQFDLWMRVLLKHGVLLTFKTHLVDLQQCSNAFLESSSSIQTEQEPNYCQISCSVLQNNQPQLKYLLLTAQAASPSNLFTTKAVSCLHCIMYTPF